MSLLEAELPAGRRWAKVGDFYEITRKPRGLDISRFASIPFAPMDAIPLGGEFEPEYTQKAPTAITSGTYFEKSDILVAKITPSFENGKQALAIGLPADFGYATTEVIPLRPRHAGHDRRLLFYFLLHPDVRAFVAEKMEGTTGRQRVPENVLLDLPFPEFSGDEQSTIADALHLIQRAIRAESRSLENATTLKRATMRELFTRGLRGEAQKETEIGLVPESWEVVECEALAEAITVGVVVRPASYYVSDGVPAFRSLNIKEDRIESSPLVYFSPQDNEGALSKSRLNAGDILVVRTGYPGTSCVVPPEYDGSNCIDLVVVRPKHDAIVSGFLSRFLNSDFGKIQALSNSYGLAQQHLNVGAVRRLRVPLPNTLQEQREIVDILDAIDHKIDLHKRKGAVLEDLFKALLHKLMTGEIRVCDLDLSALSQTPLAEAAA